jgi:hypothetical protein
MTTKKAGLKPLRLPQGKPALRKAPGPLTNEKRERALGYKIGPTLRNDPSPARFDSQGKQGKQGGAPEKPKASERSFGAKARLRMTTLSARREILRPPSRRSAADGRRRTQNDNENDTLPQGFRPGLICVAPAGLPSCRYRNIAEIRDW